MAPTLDIRGPDDMMGHLQESRRMTRRLAHLPWIVALFALLAGCEGNPVGRACFIGADAAITTEHIVASPALECQSRTCLHMAGQALGQADLCTGECGSDEDCDKVKESPCQSGFACVVPVVVGPFCCKKFCVCRDPGYLAAAPH